MTNSISQVPQQTAGGTVRRSIIWYLRTIVIALLVFVCGILTLFGILPAPEDPIIPLEQQGGGARQGDDATTGLQLVWPQIAEVNPNEAELGWYLFYDPVLSANNDISCATCHHPDMGFSDGKTVSLGSHGEDLRRNAPSLWNVAYATSLFWDGRAQSLEEQMLVPLTSQDEMGADLEEMITELRAIPEYVEKFNAIYGPAFPAEEAVTVDNVVAAIASFERSLISNQAPFDKFAAGDFNALTPAQRRGFDIFRSAETRCFECHAWPTFTHNTFHVLGVPDRDPNNPDLGQIEVVNAADAERAFRIPGLRNVALSGPYFHNGAFATLEEVVDFYSKGGGPAFGLDIQVDEKLRGFTLDEQGKADLVAFLYALTDEPDALIAIPEAVPSGLAVVERLDNPEREKVELSVAPPYSPETHEPTTITVKAGESIQAAIDKALPGDTILIEPGIYKESVYVDIANITVRGITGDNPEDRPWLDGENQRSDGFNTTGDNFVIEGLGFRGYIGNAILTTGAEGVVYRDLVIEGAKGEEVSTIYGIYPVECTDVLIENNVVTGIADAAIYVGQSRGPIIVRNNEVFGNVTGIEIENSTNADVYDNHVYDNAGGILVFLLPNNPSKVGYNTRVYNNLVEDNNHVNFGAPGSTVALVPSGTGIMIMTADNTEVFNNTIRNNKTMGLGLTSLYIMGYSRDTVFDLGPLPENNWVHDNIWENNGYDPDGLVREIGIPGADILWTGEGWNNAFDEPTASKFPPLLPQRAWPDPAKRALWRVYDIVIGLLL